MIVEVAVVAALAIGVYNFVVNASFRSKVVADFTALEAKVPGFVSAIKSAFGKIEAAVKNDLSKL